MALSVQWIHFRERASTMGDAGVKVIGIVGGVASGKSYVAQAFVRQGAFVIDADRVGHEVLRDVEVKQALVDRWGKRILEESGEISRPIVGSIVFGTTSDALSERKFLESLSHPRIRQRILNQLAVLRQANCPAVILDAALLLETGLSELCDAILFVEVPDDIRKSRALARGWTAEQWQTREANQLPLAAKRGRSQFVIDNSDAASLDTQAKQVWSQLGLGNLPS